MVTQHECCVTSHINKGIIKMARTRYLEDTFLNIVRVLVFNATSEHKIAAFDLILIENE